MKTKIVYWRLALLLSLIPAILWIIVWLVNGSLPMVKPTDTSLYAPIAWLWDIVPPLMLNRWWDIPGVFMVVFTIHNFPYKAIEIWNKNPQGFLMGICYLIIAPMPMAIGVFIVFLASLLVNIWIAFILFILDFLIITILLYFAQQIPDNWQLIVNNWIMQKEKEEKSWKRIFS